MLHEMLVERRKKCRVWEKLWKWFRRDHDRRDTCENPLATQSFLNNSGAEFLLHCLKFSSDREKLWREMFYNYPSLSYFWQSTRAEAHISQFYTLASIADRSFAVSLVPLFARSTLNPENCLAYSSAHFNTRSRAKRQQNKFHSRKKEIL